jgi:methionyl-tRNA formyltransferase
MTPRVVLFGDAHGVPIAAGALPSEVIAGLVCASTRPASHDAIRDFGTFLGIPVLVQPRRSDPEYAAFADALVALQPDLAIVCSYAMKVEAPCTAVNLHVAPLPRYRGPNPIQWAILNDERETAVTLHHLAPEFDAGDIVDQIAIPIPANATWREVDKAAEEPMRHLIAQHWRALIDGTAPRTPQDEALATTSRRRTPEDGLIDWTRSVREIHNLIRALVAPLPGAFYFDGGEKVVIDRYMTEAEVAELKAKLSSRA